MNDDHAPNACLLCGTVAAGEFQVGVFFPNAKDQKRVGAPPKKTRGLVYLLCVSCSERSDCLDQVEEKLLRVARVV
jgi:hypothetical protein